VAHAEPQFRQRIGEIAAKDRPEGVNKSHRGQHHFSAKKRIYIQINQLKSNLRLAQGLLAVLAALHHMMISGQQDESHPEDIDDRPA